MELPSDVRVNESTNGFWWIKRGILYSKGKPDGVKPSQEDTRKNIELLRSSIGDKKICMILDITYSKSPGREDRDFAAVELEKMAKAIAMVTTSPVGKMVANLFFGLKPPTYPVKMFNNLEDAESWVLQYV